jgi:hypothetical protein
MLHVPTCSASRLGPGQSVLAHWFYAVFRVPGFMHD